VRALGCHSAQGFYFGYPTADAVRQLVAQPVADIAATA
jgi:EAL domain-containing protein (putative c-di-GMP-specific phosphodiesterase class I)